MADFIAGLDATPMLVPLRRFGEENSRALPSFPAVPPLDSAPERRLMVSWWERSTTVWKLGPRVRERFYEESDSKIRQIVASIKIQVGPVMSHGGQTAHAQDREKRTSHRQVSQTTVVCSLYQQWQNANFSRCTNVHRMDTTRFGSWMPPHLSVRKEQNWFNSHRTASDFSWFVRTI